MKPQHTAKARTDIYASLGKTLAAGSQEARHALDHKCTRFQSFIVSGDLERACATIASMASYQVQVFVEEVLRAGWTAYAKAGLQQVLARINLCARIYEAAGFPYADTADEVADSALSAIELTHWICFASAGLQQWHIAERLAEHLLRFHEGGCITFPSKTDDIQYRHLLHFMALGIARKEWPAVASFDLGPYGRLIESRADTARWQEALMNVSDFKMARQQGYPDADGAPRIAISKRALYMMENAHLAAWPAELWAIQSLARSIDRIEVGLAAPHPWLNNALVQVPSLNEAPVADEQGEQLETLATASLPAWTTSR